jgi:acetyl esterase/lipase
LLYSVLSFGWTVVSPDFRVLPESNGFAAIEDVLAAYRWIVANPSECGHTVSQGSRRQSPEIILAGASSGGWCALVAALHFCAQADWQQPRLHHQHVSTTPIYPKALLLLYPMLDLSSLRWYQPVFVAPEPMCEITVRDSLVSADQRVKDRVISLGEAFPTSEAEMQTRKRLPLLWAIMQSGRWLDYLTGVEGFAVDVADSGIEATTMNWNLSDNDGNDPQQLFPLDFANFNTLSSSVATLVIHGTKDLEIPISESETLLERIEDARMGDSETGGVKFYPVQGAGHVFDLDIDPGNVNIDISDMQEDKGIERGYISVLAKALRDLRRITE